MHYSLFDRKNEQMNGKLVAFLKRRRAKQISHRLIAIELSQTDPEVTRQSVFRWCKAHGIK